MKFVSALSVWAAAAVSGWLAAGRLTGFPAMAPVRAAPHGKHAAPAQKNRSAPFLRPPSAGSAGFPGLAARLSTIPRAHLEAAEEAIGRWPEGTARNFALLFLEQRKAQLEDPFYDPAEPADGPEVAVENRFRDLAANLAAGRLDSFPFFDGEALEDWVRFEPAEAMAAVLAVPRDTPDFSGAVDVAVHVLAMRDPLEAVDFYRRSGDRCIHRGVAYAWARLASSPAEDTTKKSAGRQLLRELTPAARDHLFGEMAIFINGEAYCPLPERALPQIAAEVAAVATDSPGAEAFFDRLLTDKEAAATVLQHLSSLPAPGPGQQMAIGMLAAPGFEETATFHGLDAALASLEALPPGSGRQGALDRAASSLADVLAREDRWEEAARLMSLVQDRAARRILLQALIPPWMKHDPAAAGAALEAEPLTVLEREKLQELPIQ